MGHTNPATMAKWSNRTRHVFVRMSMLLVWLFLLEVKAAEPGVDATRGLLERLVPGHAGQFELEIIAKDPAGDVFEIESRAGKIVLRGNNGVALASGINWYLKYYCDCHVSLKARQLKLPNPLPRV